MRLYIRSSGERALLLCMLLLMLPAMAWAQVPSLEATGVPTISRNSTANLHAEGDSLWVGSFLNLTADGGNTWFVADADSLFGSRNTVFSIDVEGETIWAGLGFSSREGSNNVASAAGFLVSEDGGATFQYRFPQLDGGENDTETYGVSTLSALPVIVPQQSPPFDVDYDPVRDEVWMAGWASGIRHSTDGGRNWNRVVLPPDSLDSIHPDTLYDFRIEPRRGLLGFFNYLGFSVLVDETGTVWAGTVAGVNRSTPDDITPSGERAWSRFGFDGTSQTLTGNWVISIEEQPLAGRRNPIWMASWDGSDGTGPRQRFGVTVTRDGGETFEQVLRDERVFDFAFKGDTVYVAGENGLFITKDGGDSWRTVRDFFDPTQPDRFVPPDVEVNSVAVTANGDLWVGTTDGLFKSSDNAETWRIFRVEVPVNTDNPTDAIPDVASFAYPNPFSPFADRLTRIRYELSDQRDVRVRIFDFGMNLVRDLHENGAGAGVRETVWDGRDKNGLRVANGPYFYVVEAGSDAFRGKILVIE
ncbi:MAG: FlgD immunoglobulin-like domain containing protein [Bacteroidota bacterium]